MRGRTKREEQFMYAKKVKWTLVDDHHERFDTWCSDAGYMESFRKGVDPNITHPYGNNCLLTDEEIKTRLGLKEKQEKDISDKNGGKWGGSKAGCHEPWNKGKSVNDILAIDASSKVMRG